jgi:hypothetical protein
MFGFTIICLTIGFPFAYRSLVIRAERSRGLALADEQWASGDAVVFCTPDDLSDEDAAVEFGVDPATGLQRRPKRPDFGFKDAYNARIAELISLHGVPSWSLKKYIPTADDVVALLDSKDLKEITEFPHQLTASIVLMRRGTVTWGNTTYGSGDDSLSIVSERAGVMSVGDGVHRVYARVDDPIVVIRNGKTWVGIFHKDGRMIASASRRF